eukprot:jgi/Orpsp1_1/1184158/evm.model.c7180000088249.1
MNYLYLLSILLLFINIIYAENGKKIRNKEGYYLVFVNNTHGEFDIYSDSKYEKRDESQIFIESLIEEINELIVDNIDTYKHPEKLEDFESNSKLIKRNNGGNGQPLFFTSNSDYIYPISSAKNTVVLYTYLSKPLVSKIKSIDNIYDCISNSESFFDTTKYYNEEDILNETHWSGLEVQENADFHLSLMSQGIYDKSLVNKYDNNFYYPSTAGKDINIVIIDTSFHFNHPEFSNGNRIVKCAANIKNGRPSYDINDSYCGNIKNGHGETVADVAAGYIHGVAKQANVYGVSLPKDCDGYICNNDILGAAQYVLKNLVVPHKTVITTSIAGMYETSSSFYKHFKDIILSITEKGGIYVSCAANDDTYLNKKSKQEVPCEYDNVICVGAIESTSVNNLYRLTSYTNFGPSVDVYAPGEVNVEIIKNNQNVKFSDAGTSFSTPLVA